MAENSEWQDERPGVDLAYGRIQSSYDWVLSRLNAVEGRIQALMVFSASFILTAPALVAATGSAITLASPVFLLAVGIATLNLIVGTVTRARGLIKLPGIYTDPREWLELSAYWFKFYAVEEATEHFEVNVRTVNGKGKVVIRMTILFLLETACLVIWGLLQIG